MNREHEIIGKQQVEIENLKQQYAKQNEEYCTLIRKLKEIADGQIDLSRITVDLDRLTWNIAAANETAGRDTAERSDA